ncbi:hypothetical protein LSH36_485g01017 [Paralvinella palmiformis]|uniref:EGF-like domain-containing protein n=1 Tax=Paralvinella palmiformis TaxID=53620 RepID=A0AAD9J933_9ANNE|nr:hypothetical protein LSH36_485g01017 [Paralvinella palmiformis]
MLVIKDFVILVIILTKTGCCQEIVPTRLVSTEKRPLDDDLVFIINTNTKAQCHYICIQNNECVAVIYRDTGYLCHGYKTMYEEEYLVEDEYGWHVERTGKKENACDDNPLLCQNGGVCKEVDGLPKCSCNPGFKGRICESKIFMSNG